MSAPPAPLDLVTGAFGYSGQFIARKLLAIGRKVRTLTRSQQRSSTLAGQIDVRPYDFEHPTRLVDSLRGVDTLYNTYWVRFNHRHFTFAQAVANSRLLFAAARDAGVRRIIHVSITNPSLNSPLEYFSGKAQVENALRETGVSFAILRPAVLFGGPDILINNIAFMLRRMPFFGVFGNGQYRLQPIHVEDFTALAIRLGRAQDNTTINAIGPETFTYRQLVQTISQIIGRPRSIIPISPALGFLISKLAGMTLRDVVVTHDEIRGLMSNLLYVDTPPPPESITRLTDWARAHATTLGSHYASELGRRRNRAQSYDPL